MSYKSVKGMITMYYFSNRYPYPYSFPYYAHHPMYSNPFDYRQSSHMGGELVLKDYGSNPFVVNIEEATKQNSTFRTALWTGEHLQVTLMSIPVGEDIGLEVHPDNDQFLRIEEGQGVVQMGDTQNNLSFQRNVQDDDSIMVPAGKWHNLTNTV